MTAAGFHPFWNFLLAPANPIKPKKEIDNGTPECVKARTRERHSPQPMDFTQVALIFVVSTISCSFGTLVGGSSLINIPVMILMGLPPHAAIGTDRVSALGLGLAGLYTFHRKGMMQYRLALIVAIPTLFGAFIGANLALQISPELLNKVIVALTVVLLLVVALNPRLGVVAESNRPLTARRYILGAFLVLLVSIYNGFYGGGGGTLLSYIMILVYQQTFLESAANLKVGTVASFTISTATYAWHGAIHLPFVPAIFAGSCLGSYLGARYSDRLGNVWIKRIFIAVILVMVVKLLLDA